MGASWVKVGAVFRWANDERPGRVLVDDGAVVMYDVWWPHLGAWGLADLNEARRGAVGYFVTFTSTLLAKAEFLRDEPLTASEESLHRPDLPFAVVRRSDLSWPAAEPDVAAFAAAFSTSTVALTVPEVCLRAFSPGGASKRAVRVSADDKAGFTVADLMRKAARVQMEHLGHRRTVDGVGVYRDGLHRGRPSFYLWGAASRLETHVAEFERRRQSHEAEHED